MADDREGAARAVMRNVDGLPPEFRVMVHSYGYRQVWKAYLKGWSPERIEAAATADGCFSTAKAKKHNAMGVPRSLFGRRALAGTAEDGERDGVGGGRDAG